MFLTSCQTENTETDIITKKVEKISLFGKNVNGKMAPINGTIEFEFNETTEQVVGINASQNILVYLNMTDDQLETYVYQQMNVAESTSSDKPKHDHASCISNCIKEYTNPDGTKKPGRGNCKFNCWVSTAVQIITVIAPLL